MSFEHLSNNARVWVYVFKSELDADQEEIVKNKFDQFVAGWQCHGAELTGAYQLIESKVLILAVEEANSVSGCSIDSSVRVLKQLKDDHGIDALDQTLIHYRKGDDLETVNRAIFDTLCKTGDISQETKVIDPLLNSMSDLRSGKLEKDFAKSWHASAFKLV